MIEAVVAVVIAVVAAVTMVRAATTSTESERDPAGARSTEPLDFVPAEASPPPDTPAPVAPVPAEASTLPARTAAAEPGALAMPAEGGVATLVMPAAPTPDQIAAALGSALVSPNPDRLIQHEVFVGAGAVARLRALARLLTAIVVFGALLGGGIIAAARGIGLLFR